VFIGLTVTIIICIIAPLTQAGLNPARDLSPRLFSYLAGWGRAASPDNNFGLVVYGLAPIIGALIAAIFFTKIIEPIFLARDDVSSCCVEGCDNQD
jgi:glycerol uptake facilitator protein